MTTTRRAFLGGVMAGAVVAGGCGRVKDANGLGIDAADTEAEKTDMTKLKAKGAKLNLPLLERLHEVDREVDRLFPPEILNYRGLDRVGLILPTTLEPGNYEYCSPKNGLVFASTGGDGDHYSLLVHDGVVDDKSPVVMTWPSEACNTVVGESLYDFLCHGLYSGYFQLSFGIDEPLTVESGGMKFCAHVEAQQAAILAHLAKTLDLKPWPQKERVVRMNSLKKRFGGMVQSEALLQ